MVWDNYPPPPPSTTKAGRSSFLPVCSPCSFLSVSLPKRQLLPCSLLCISTFLPLCLYLSLSLSALLSLLPFPFARHNPLNKYPTSNCMACLPISVFHQSCGSLSRIHWPSWSVGHLGAPCLGPDCHCVPLWCQNPLPTACNNLGTCSMVSRPAVHCCHSGICSVSDSTATWEPAAFCFYYNKHQMIIIYLCFCLIVYFKYYILIPEAREICFDLILNGIFFCNTWSSLCSFWLCLLFFIIPTEDHCWRAALTKYH